MELQKVTEIEKGSVIIEVYVQKKGNSFSIQKTIHWDLPFGGMEASAFKMNSRFVELAMNYQFITKIWRPDTFFLNGKDSYLHKMTVPNRFIRIAPNGRISYSQRLTIKASCQMNLRKFPLDSQSCPLLIGSFGHDTGDIVYKVGLIFWCLLMQVSLCHYIFQL